MQIRKLLHDDDAVSPVIGVILMVAITVILAAVIASFVLGLGGSQQQTPQASFSWDFEQKNASSSYVQVGHDGGDTIRHDELIFRGTGFNNSIDDSEDHVLSKNSGGHEWPGTATSGMIGSTSAVTGGDFVKVGATSEFEISLIWEPEEGDTSATLAEESGPDA
ncbi:type IV pilin N-terminal domain-containing protein [Halorientalis halophila]|uniref:type IV pilin N-terminal domain-containing protein n=1 Tax=Halorientalis halophila TaxID=3108499 RepID=UPI003008871F